MIVVWGEKLENNIVFDDDLKSDDSEWNAYVKEIMQDWSQADGDPATYVANYLRRGGFEVRDVPEPIGELVEYVVTGELTEAWDPSKHKNDPDAKYTKGGNSKQSQTRGRQGAKRRDQGGHRSRLNEDHGQIGSRRSEEK